MTRRYLTTRQVARLLGCETGEIWRHLRQGRLDVERVVPPPAPGRARATTIIRIYPRECLDYIAVYWPRVLRDQPLLRRAAELAEREQVSQADLARALALLARGREGDVLEATRLLGVAAVEEGRRV